MYPACFSQLRSTNFTAQRHSQHSLCHIVQHPFSRSACELVITSRRSVLSYSVQAPPLYFDWPLTSSPSLLRLVTHKLPPPLYFDWPLTSSPSLLRLATHKLPLSTLTGNSQAPSLYFDWPLTSSPSLLRLATHKLPLSTLTGHSQAPLSTSTGHSQAPPPSLLRLATHKFPLSTSTCHSQAPPLYPDWPLTSSPSLP